MRWLLQAIISDFGATFQLVGEQKGWSLYVEPANHFVFFAGGPSYLLYLVHPLIYLGADWFLEMKATVIAGFFVFACVVSILVDFVFERPSQKFVKSREW